MQYGLNLSTRNLHVPKIGLFQPHFCSPKAVQMPSLRGKRWAVKLGLEEDETCTTCLFNHGSDESISHRFPLAIHFLWKSWKPNMILSVDFILEHSQAVNTSNESCYGSNVQSKTACETMRSPQQIVSEEGFTVTFHFKRCLVTRP